MRSRRSVLMLIGLTPLAVFAVVTIAGHWFSPPMDPAHLGATALLLISAATVLVTVMVGRRLSQEETSLAQNLADRIRNAHIVTPTDIGPDDDPVSEALVKVQRSVLKARAEQTRARHLIAKMEQDIDHRVKERTSALATSEETIRLLIQSVPEAIYGVDGEGLCTFCNAACIRLLGYEDESNLVGKPVSELMPTDEVHTMQAVKQGKPVHVDEATFWRADGEFFLVEYWSFPVIKDQTVVGAVVSFIDVTQRKKVEAALFREKEYAQVTLNSIADGVITTNASGSIRYLNPVAEELLGWTKEAATGQTFHEVFMVCDEDTHEPDRGLLTRHRNGLSKHGPKASSLLARRHAKPIHVEHTVAPIHDRDGSTIGFIIVFRDVSESQQLARQLAYQATHDSLTGMINRGEFEQRVQRQLDADPSKRPEAAICYLDLDQFKIVNDTCGHTAGDELLRQLSELLRSKIRQRDTLARLGGDEFGILLEHCSLGEAFRIANGIREAIHEYRFGWDDKTFSLGVSIGLVEVTPLHRSLGEVLTAADSACYMAKEKGRNRVQLHHPEDREVRERQGEINWLTRINKAIADDDFVLFHQEIIDTRISVDPDRPRRLEILVRMVDSEGQLALPGAFLPAAERYNLIQATDRWVVRAVFDWLSQPALASIPLIASINLSGPTISDASFLEYVLGELDRHCIDPAKICFEITETAAIAKLTNAIHLIQQLKQRGFCFALDDFGSGLSSFGYLKQLPVDYLKIDGAFIRDIVHDPIDRAMVRSINDIGHIMGKKTIAEYVESDEILEILREIGIDYAQGYGIAVPRALTELQAELIGPIPPSTATGSELNAVLAV